MQSAVTSAAHDAVRQQARRHDDSSAVIGTDENGTVLYWSPGAEALYGWTEAEALGRSVVDVTPAMMSRRSAEHIMHELLAGKSWSGDFTVRHRDGSAITVQVVDEPVLLEGKVVGIVGISSRR
jgi:PAS domain S-box-containing protein